MRRSPSFRRGTAVRLRRRGLIRRIWAGIKGVFTGHPELRERPAEHDEILPRMTRREIKVLSRELIRKAKGGD